MALRCVVVGPRSTALPNEQMAWKGFGSPTPLLCPDDNCRGTRLLLGWTEEQVSPLRSEGNGGSVRLPGWRAPVWYSR